MKRIAQNEIIVEGCFNNKLVNRKEFADPYYYGGDCPYIRYNRGHKNCGFEYGKHMEELPEEGFPDWCPLTETPVRPVSPEK